MFLDARDDHGGVVQVSLLTGSQGCQRCYLSIFIDNPEWYADWDTDTCYFQLNEYYDIIAPNTLYTFTGDQLGGCSNWEGGDPTRPGWQLDIMVGLYISEIGIHISQYLLLLQHL